MKPCARLASFRRPAATPAFHWITPAPDQLGDGTAEWLAADVGASMDLIKLVRRRAEEDADLQAGPLFAMLVLTDQPIPRTLLETYVTGIRDEDADAARELATRTQSIAQRLAGRRAAERADLWADTLGLVRRTLRPSLDG